MAAGEAGGVGREGGGGGGGVVCLSSGWRRRRGLQLLAGRKQHRVQRGKAALVLIDAPKCLAGWLWVHVRFKDLSFDLEVNDNRAH